MRINMSYASARALALAAMMLSWSTADATWPTDPSVNLPIATALWYNSRPQIVWDGASSFTIVWQFAPDFTQFEIYAQKVTVDGDTLWTMNGDSVTTAVGTQQFVRAVTDDDFGIIAAWEDSRGGVDLDIYAQRVSPSGTTAWASDVAVCVAIGDQSNIEMIADGYGGAIIVWEDYRSGPNPDIYAERIDANGNLLWGSGNGVPVCTAVDDQRNPCLVSDGAGGSILAWSDSRESTDIFAQRMDANGDSVWAADGIPVSTQLSAQFRPAIATDNAGGAIITWSTFSGDIYAQRVNADGDTLWQLDGVPICTAAFYRDNAVILSDGSSGAIICWQDNRDDFTIYANRVDGSGGILWATDGLVVCEADHTSGTPRMVSDGQGGVIIAWEDTRNVRFQKDIYAQRVSASGTMQWTLNGVAITTADNWQHHLVIAADGHGGAVIAWEDDRNNDIPRVYAQRVDSTGNFSTPTGIPKPRPSEPLGLALLPNYPNPFGGGTLLQFELAAPSEVYLEVFDVQGRRVYSQQLGRRSEGGNVHFFAGRDVSGSALPTGVYFARLSASGHRRTLKLNLVR